MLENTEPFKSMLTFYSFCGFWRPKSLTPRHRKIAQIAFVLLKELPFILVVFSILQDSTVYEYAKSSTVIFSSLMNSAYIMTFLLMRKQIQKLFDELNKTINSRPDSLQYVNDELQKVAKLEKRKVIGTSIWVLMGVVSSIMIKEASVQMWQPQFLKNRADFFYILWFYQSLHIIYMAFVALFMQDFFFTFLRVIKALMKYLRNELKTIKLSEQNGKILLIQCVEIHRDIRSIMRKYTKIAAIPIATHMLVGAYILCTAAIIISSDKNEGEVGSFIGMGIITSMQLLYPCYVGQEIEIISQNMMENIIESDWLTADVKVKKQMTFFMQNLNQPVVKLNLFSIFDVNLTTFISIINTAYSTYAVLNNLR